MNVPGHRQLGTERRDPSSRSRDLERRVRRIRQRATQPRLAIRIAGVERKRFEHRLVGGQLTLAELQEPHSQQSRLTGNVLAPTREPRGHLDQTGAKRSAKRRGGTSARRRRPLPDRIEQLANRLVGECLPGRLHAQNNPTVLPSASMSTFSAAGDLPSPGIC